MAVLDKIPETNVQLVDIRDTINKYGGTADNNLVTFFQQNDVNMWAKFKPVRLSGINFINLWDSTSQGNYGYMGDIGDTVTCGIYIPEYTSPQLIRNALLSGDSEWEYRPPTGTSSNPMRLGDFRRYIYKAECPVGRIGDLILKTTNKGYEIEVNVEVVVQESDLNLTLTDLSMRGVKLKDMFLGVFLYQSASKYLFQTSDTPIGDNGELNMVVKADDGMTGKFKAYMFLSTSAQKTASTNYQEQSGLFYSLHRPASEGENGYDVEIKDANNLVVFSISANAVAIGSKQFEYGISINNTTTGSVTYPKLYVHLQQYIDGKWQSEGYDQLVAQNYTIPAKTKKDLSGTLSHSVAFTQTGMWAIYVHDGSKQLAWNIVETDLGPDE